MKLLRLKITAPDGFRSLHCGFEHDFRSEWDLHDDPAKPEGFEPFVCAGSNGSGKSNLLEVLAAIFYHLECIYLVNLPDSFRYDKDTNPGGFRSEKSIPDGFEIEYLTQRPTELPGEDTQVRIKILKCAEQAPQWFLWSAKLNDWDELPYGQTLRRALLPDYVLGYSSGENEILSLPFFKLRFVQFDEYWQALKQQLPYPGRPETRMAYLDNGFSQAILLCNLLLQDDATLQTFREDVGIEALQEFRIIIKRSIEVPADIAEGFIASDYVEKGYVQDGYTASNPALRKDTESGRYTVNLIQLLEARSNSAKNFDPLVTRLSRCATLSYVDDATDTLILDFWVNDETKMAFRANFENDPLMLFQAFQVLLTLNLYSVSNALKTDLYRSTSHYASETVPTLASDERIMRFKFVRFSKERVGQPIMLKELSDGEHQLLHSLGLCLLFRDTNSLFLLDEPETHFNPDWRASFISRLSSCLQGREGASQEMLITTHSPFLISDSKPEKVLLFAKDKASGAVSISRPDYNTLGASINKITMTTFGKRETMGRHAQAELEAIRRKFEHGENASTLIDELNDKLGDSVEKVLLIKAILDRAEAQG